MRKFIIIFCVASFATNVIMGQTILRIDDKGISIGNCRNCSDCDSENDIEFKPKPAKSKTFFTSVGFILPNNGGDYFATLGGSSLNLNMGMMHRYRITDRFALGRTLQYSYYNYRSWNEATNPEFANEVIGKDYDRHGIRKQAFRSHNLAVSGFTRFYLVPDKSRLYIDLGAQGDFAYSKFFKIKTQKEGKSKYRDDFAFNPFAASAIARIGWDKRRCSCTVNGKCCWGNKSRSIFVRYRLTDAFNSKALSMDLPPITIGIQIF